MMAVKQIHSKIATYITIRAGLTPVLWGKPGVGKTAFVYGLAKRLGMEAIVHIAALHESVDYGGLPVKDEQHGVAKYLPLEWLDQLASDKSVPPTLIIFDEIDKATPEVQNAILRIILEGVAGGIRLHKNVKFILVANPLDAGGEWQLTAPLANRLVHLPFPPDLQAFTNWLLTNDWENYSFTDKVSVWDEVAYPEVKWEKVTIELRRWAAIISAFLNRFGEGALHDFPENESERGGAWASSRTWEFALRLISVYHSCEPQPPKEVLALLLQGTVGRQALPFLSFSENLDIPSPEEVLNNFNLLPSQPDKLYIVLSSVISHLASHSDPNSLLPAVSDLMLYIERERGVDFAYLMLRWTKGVVERYKLNKEIVIQKLKQSKLLQLPLS